MGQAEQDWSEHEFEGLDLGDARLNKRAKKVAGDLAARPQAPINQASEDHAATKAAYRLFQNQRTSSDAILAPHTKRTIERVSMEKVVLAIQDTSYLNYSSHEMTEGLGPIGDGQRSAQGLVMHSAMAVTTEGLPLGLLGQKIWSRKEYKRRTKLERWAIPIESKESHRWIECIEALSAMTPKSTRMVNVSDRESDIYELFVVAQKLNVEFIVRGSWNRKVHDAEGDYLRDAISKQKSSGSYSLEVLEEDGTKRTASIEVRFCQVTLRPPQRKSRRLEPVTVYAIEAKESASVSGINKKGIDWLLLSNMPIDSFDDAMEKISWYRLRWHIETYHKILKSGCRIESCRLQTASRLTPFIAMMAVVAWRLFWLTYIKRTNPKAPASQILTSAELKLLYWRENKKRFSQGARFSVAQAVIAIAKMGGFLARKGDGHPGVITTWRGWTRLQDHVAAADYYA